MRIISSRNPSKQSRLHFTLSMRCSTLRASTAKEETKRWKYGDSEPRLHNSLLLRSHKAVSHHPADPAPRENAICSIQNPVKGLRSSGTSQLSAFLGGERNTRNMTRRSRALDPSPTPASPTRQRPNKALAVCFGPSLTTGRDQGKSDSSHVAVRILHSPIWVLPHPSPVLPTDPPARANHRSPSPKYLAISCSAPADCLSEPVSFSLPWVLSHPPTSTVSAPQAPLELGADGLYHNVGNVRSGSFDCGRGI